MDKTTPFQPWAAEESAKSIKTEREVVDDAKLHRENVNHPKHTQTASYDKESVSVASNAPGSSSITGADTVPGMESKMDTTKVASMQQIVENTLSQEGRQRVAQLLEAVEALSGAERLLLYLRLPTGVPPHDPLKQPINPLGSRAELQQTVTWIQTHLEVDPDVSLPKQDVYDEYIAHCMTSNMKPLSTADFGKVMKQVYPSVRPRRLGTRGNSRYCYAGLRKKVKLEVPQLPTLGESSKLQEVNIASKETERIVCDWAELKLGIKFTNISELSRHLMAAAVQHTAPGPASSSPPPLGQSHVSPDDAASRQLITQLKRKIQTQGAPGRPRKKKAQEASESPPSTSYAQHTPAPVKHEDAPEYGYHPPYVYEVRAPYAAFGPPRAHPHPHPHPSPADYRPEAYAYEQGYARDLSLNVPDPALNVPINLSSDARGPAADWARRRPPEPPPRLPLPGKKLILETYHSETQGSSPRAPPEPRPPPTQEEFPRAEYLPKKMRAAEIMGGKLAAARHAANDGPSASADPTPARSAVAFLEDPKNLTSRSKSTAAALAREEQEAASPTRSTKAQTPRPERSERRPARPRPPASPDTCCGLDGINIKTGMICEEKHSEILNRERVISICNIDKHDLDDYLNEGNSQEHEEELLQYFQAKDAEPTETPSACDAASFLETNQDPHDDHSQGKNEKISQLRELLAKNLKNQNSSSQNASINQDQQQLKENSHEQTLKLATNDGAFKPLGDVDVTNGPPTLNQIGVNNSKMCNSVPNENGTAPPFISNSSSNHPNCQNEPQSPTSRTQQYDFVPISDGCQSPGNFNSKSPLGFSQSGHSPTKINKSVMGNSLQTSPISHSTAASPFVSPRNTPVPRSKFCPRPIPKLNGRKRRNPLSLGVVDQCHKQFAIPNDQKFLNKMPVCGPGKFCQSIQPMSAPPSPNILNSQYKAQLFHCAPVSNGAHNLSLNFLPNTPIRDHMDRELTQPLSADPLSSEVSQFFQEPLVNYRPVPDSFRSQSVPLKQGINNMCLLSYNNTPVGSVPPTPVPNEFCDFGSLADTCDISKAGLNSETLDKIYNAIDSSNDVLNTNAAQTLLNSNNTLSNGCDHMPEQTILSDEQLGSLMPSGDELLDRSSQFNQSFTNDATSTDNVEDFLKRPNSIEFDLSELESDKNKFYTSRSVPSTPLPFKRAASNLQIDSCRPRELFPAENSYSNASNGISSKSVPSTPQLVEDRSVFSYSNRDYLINGNSVGGSSQIHDIVMDNDQSLASPLNDMLREDMLDPLTPALLADLDKMDAPYVDL
ncbi:unnamed protein product [Chilo suppressalis]|uniref:RFX-type winged-helix domain-containing protein n=1 Tax=Chilo suppressalis TaxID=168631 RepID=A0ABN8EC67_CHISP|nr:unnamed protein product [Chilo suppressalis]